MSTRTKEEITESIQALKREVRHCENRRAEMCQQLATLEAELAALPVEPEVLVVLGTEKDFALFIHVKGAEENDDHIAVLFTKDCALHGLDPALLARQFAASQVAHALIDLTYCEDGTFKGVIGNSKQLAARYFAALEGEVKP